MSADRARGAEQGSRRARRGWAAGEYLGLVVALVLRVLAFGTPICLAMSRTDLPAASPHEISSRSAT